MKKKPIILTAFCLSSGAFSFGQNVGIGTATPAVAYRLHIHDNVNNDASIGITNALTTNANLRGTRLRVLNSDFLINNQEPGGKIGFITNASTRMTIGATGNVGIGTTAPAYSLEIFKSVAAINAYSQNTALTGTAYGFVADISSDVGAAIAGTAISGGSAAFISDRYGVLGTVGSIGVAVGGFGLGGSTALYGQNTDAAGYALRTNGRIKLNGIGETPNAVLTSDASGNASWQSLPGGSSAWALTGNNLSNTNTGQVGIGTSVFDSRAKLHILFGDNTMDRLTMESPSTSNGFGLKLKNPEHEWTMGVNLGNYPDGRFNLYHNLPGGGSAAQFFTVMPNGNVGIGDYTGIGLAPTERLEIKDGFMKVSGANKTAFTITATASNSGGHILNLNYANQAATDILIVTHNYNPPGGPSAYHNQNVGVFWNGTRWTIYNENTAVPILGISFNVLVIKQ